MEGNNDNNQAGSRPALPPVNVRRTAAPPEFNIPFENSDDSRTYLETGERDRDYFDQPVSPTTSPRGSIDRGTSSAASSIKGSDKKRGLPRLRSALSHVQLPSLKGRNMGSPRAGSPGPQQIPSVAVDDTGSASASTGAGQYQTHSPASAQYTPAGDMGPSISSDGQSRRPSYASVTTRSSVGSRLSQPNGAEDMAADTSGRPSISDLSLAGDSPQQQPANPSSSQIVLDQSPSQAGRSGSPLPMARGMTFPDPVFDTRAFERERFFDQPPSRAGSVASTISTSDLKGGSGSSRKAKKSIFGKLLPASRKEAAAAAAAARATEDPTDEDPKPESSSHKHEKEPREHRKWLGHRSTSEGVKAKHSAANLHSLRGNAADSSSRAHAGRSSRDEKGPAAARPFFFSGHPMGIYPQRPPAAHSQRPRSSSHSSSSRNKHSTPRRVESSLDMISGSDQSGSSGRNSSNASTVFALDTNLGTMAGIVGSGRRGTGSQAGVVAPTLGLDHETWQAPESWGVAQSLDTETPTPILEESQIVSEPKSRETQFVLRVFKDDGTFSTLPSKLNTAAAEVIEKMFRKTRIKRADEDEATLKNTYHLTLTTGPIVRTLKPNEKPVVLQIQLLEAMGYTERDRINEVGREDLSYLCKFSLTDYSLTGIGELHLEGQDVSHVELRARHLETIPVALFQRAAEIQFLDASENPGMTLPKDFIQACINLTEVRFGLCLAQEFPVSLCEASALVHLDLSSNGMKTIANAPIERFQHLVSLNLQGNKLTALPDTIGELQNLRFLDVSSNSLAELNPNICRLTGLVELSASFNRVEQLPANIGDLINLEVLHMTNNFLSKQLPSSIAKLVNLRECDIRYNQLQTVDVLCTLPKLDSLLASRNNVFALEASHTQITTLGLDRNHITKISFSQPQMSLTSLNLAKSKLTTLSDKFLDSIPMLEELILDRNHLTELPGAIGNLRRLKKLSISNNALSTLPPRIGLLSELVELDLHSNNITTLPQEIWDLISLRVLNVSTNFLETFPKQNMHSASIGSAEVSSIYKKLQQQADQQGDGNFEIGDRRPSAVSMNSATSPKHVASSRRGSAYPFPGSASSVTPVHDSMGAASPRGRLSISHSLQVLSAADNRLTDDCFHEIARLTELEVLNLSYNDFLEVPFKFLSVLSRLRELYLSGNNLTSLPADDLENATALRALYVNGNKLHTLPAELGKISRLEVLDVGSNNLRYNINNWPYDWNWNFNLELKYLNFSGNKRLEIKNVHSSHTREEQARNLSDFTILKNIRVLGLMDVTLTTNSVPEQTEERRVRVYGSSVMSMRIGLADTLGNNQNLSFTDLVIEKLNGSDKQALFGLFDGRSASNSPSRGGNKVCKLIQESFTNMFVDELNKLRPEESPEDALRRAFLAVNKEIGNTTLLNKDEIEHTFIAHRYSTARHISETDRATGSCATVVYIADNKLYVANVGDTAAVLSRTTGEYTVVTERHDPTSKSELARIRNVSGKVSGNGKLDGVVDVSRAIGFYDLVPHVQAGPHISSYTLTDADDFVIVASRQVWDWITFETAVDLVRSVNRFESDPMLAAQKLRDIVISYGCSDKIIVMILAIGEFRKKPKMRSGVQGYNQLALQGVEEELLPALKKRRDRSVQPEDAALARLPDEVPPPVGEVAMVFTDIKNSTKLWESHQVAMRSAIKAHNSIMRRMIRIIGGYEVKTEGDAFIVSFPSVTSALLWCFGVQSLLLSADWPAEIVESEEGCLVTDPSGEAILFRGLSVRMGINWGTPVFETDVITKRMDYFGPMVNRTARISAVADGGQITVSSDFLDEFRRIRDAHSRVINEHVAVSEAYGDDPLGERLDEEFKLIESSGYVLEELGEMKLKGLENPELITLIYPSALKERAEYFRQHRTQEQLKAREMHGEGGKDVVRPKPSVGARETRTGNLTLQLLSELRFISNRIEKVCSMMKMNFPDMPTTKIGDYSRKTVDAAAQISNTDYDYMMFFEHMVTRIENACNTLALYSLAASAPGLKPNAEAAEIIDYLGRLLAATAANPPRKDSESTPLSPTASRRPS